MRDSAVKEIRYKGKVWRLCMKDTTYVTIGDTLYVDETGWNGFVKNKAVITLQSIVAHESVHAARELAMGVTLWMVSYFSSAKFRWEEEKVAYEAGWRVEVRAGETFTDADYAFFADEVSGPMYHGMTTHDEAYNFMKKTIAKLQREYKKKAKRSDSSMSATN